MPLSIRKLIAVLGLILVLANCAKWKVEPYDLVPQVQTGNAAPATTSVQVECRVTELGPNTLQEFGIVYSAANPQPTLTDTKVVATGSSDGTSVSLTGLQPNTTYYYRTYATNNKNITGYGEIKSFKTVAAIPNVQTLGVVGTPGATSIQISCEVTNVSTVALKEYGIVYSELNQSPGAANAQDTKVKATTTNGSATTITLGNLKPNTTYYCRAYAISTSDAVGESQPVLTVKTGEPLPAVETLDVVGTPGSTSAQVQCRVTNASAVSLREIGIVYSSKNQEPGANDNTIVKAPGSLTSATVSLTGLQANTDYNYWAFATNGAGSTVYGAKKQVKTAADIPSISSVTLVSTKPSKLETNSATVSFKVDKPAAVTEYGFILTPDPNQVAAVIAGTVAPLRRPMTGTFPAGGTVDYEIKDLAENGIYYAVAYAKDATGKTVFSSESAAFRTKFGQRGNWRQLGNLPTERAFVYNTLFTINGKVYVGSQSIGASSDYNYLRQLYEYDPQSNLWATKKDFPGTTRIEPTVAVLNNKVYVMFGAAKNTGGPATYTADAWEYDPETDNWRQLSNPPVTALGGSGAFNQQAGGIPFVYNNRVHSLFGRGPSTNTSLTNVYNSLYALNPAGSGSWEVSFPLAGKVLSIAETYSIIRSSAFSVQYGDWVYYGGGLIASEYTALGPNVNFGRDFNSRQIWGYNARTQEIKKVALLPGAFNDCSSTGPTGDTGGRMQNCAFVVGTKAYIVDCSHKTWVMDLTTLATPAIVASLNNPTGTVGIGVGVGNKAYFGLRQGDWWEFTP